MAFPAPDGSGLWCAVTRGPERDHPRLPARPSEPSAPIARPEPQSVAVVDPGHVEGREEELPQVLPAPAVRPGDGPPAGAGRSASRADSGRSGSRKKWQRYRSLWNSRAPCSRAVILAIASISVRFQAANDARSSRCARSGDRLVERQEQYVLVVVAERAGPMVRWPSSPVVSARTGGAAGGAAGAGGATGAGEPSRVARNSPNPSSRTRATTAAESHGRRVDVGGGALTTTGHLVGAASPRRGGECGAPWTTSRARAAWHPSGTCDRGDRPFPGRSRRSLR